MSFGFAKVGGFGVSHKILHPISRLSKEDGRRHNRPNGREKIPNVSRRGDFELYYQTLIFGYTIPHCTLRITKHVARTWQEKTLSVSALCKMQLSGEKENDKQQQALILSSFV